MFYEVDGFVDGGEGEGHACVRGAVIDGDPARFGVGKGGAGEYYVRHVADAFIYLVRGEQEAVRAVQHLPRLVDIEQGCAYAVGEAVAACEHAVIKHQPALVRFNGGRACADLGHLPILDGGHHEAVLAPIGQILASADKNIAVGRVASVTGADEQQVFAAHLAGEEHAVPRHGVAGVLKLSPALEILGVGYADGRAVGCEIDP